MAIENLIAFYRKYRPVKFSDVLGQEHVVDVLKEQVKKGNTSHAYLFSGPRGTGKTSVARILAGELDCKDTDFYEIDGASNRGIDEIRALRDAVTTLPFNSPIKIYVIDEVHMLTREAFNALLKTLEEPPDFVKFILATTELDKVPDTVSSRCQTFTFKKPKVATLKKVLLDIAKKESIKLDDDAASLIAFLGEGSFRDAEGMLEQVVLLGEKKISREIVEEILGAPRSELVRNVIDSILIGDLEKGIQALGCAEEQNTDMKIFTKLILKYIRYAMLIKLAPDVKKLIEEELGDDEYEYVTKLSNNEGVKRFPEIIRILIDTYSQIRNSYIEVMPLELALIKIIGQDRTANAGE